MVEPLTLSLASCLCRCAVVLYRSTIKNNHCKVGGQGVITAATFAMLFGLLAIFFLHVDIVGKQICGRRVPFPRVLLNLFSFLSLTLYIVTVATWYNQCYNTISDIEWPAGSENYATNITAGYAIATSIAGIVFSFFAWCLSFWRTCSPNKNEPARVPKVKAPRAVDMPAVAGPGPMSPGGSTVPYTQQASASNLGRVADEEAGSTYGGSSGAYGGAYSNGNASNESYSNDTTAGGYTSGGYGAGGSGYGSNKQESAYGY